MTSTTNSESIPMTLETATACARSNRDWDRVREYIRQNPKDLFAICSNRRWSIAHQIVYHNKTEELKRILEFYSDDEIDITTKSGDNRTLLCVATEKRTPHPDMFQYVSRVFKQNELITAAKNRDWQLVKDLLEKKKDLANEKPPYSSCFLIHYIIKNGDAKILEEFINRFQLRMNLLNKNKENPLEMANRLGKQDMCTVLRRAQNLPQPPSTTALSNTSVAGHNQNQSTERKSPPGSTTSQSNGPKHGLVPIGFSGILDDIIDNDNQTTLINSAKPPPARSNSATSGLQSPSPSPSPSPSSTSAEIKHVRMKKTIVKEVSLTEIDPIESSPPRSPSTTTSKLPPPTTTVSTRAQPPPSTTVSTRAQPPPPSTTVSTRAQSPPSPTVSTRAQPSPPSTTVSTRAQPPPPTVSTRAQPPSPSMTSTQVKPFTSAEISSSLPITDLLTIRLTCSLSNKLFVDPVIGDDGYTYERSAITQWLKTHNTSPKTNKPMETTFRNNNVIKQLVQLLNDNN